MKKIAIFAALLLLLTLLGGCRTGGGTGTVTTTTTTLPVTATREWRAVWVSYMEVAQLMAGQETDVRTAVDGLMDRCRDIGLTDVIWHVRANSDAYYASSAYPAAAAVTPLLNAGFDPLTYAVEAAHARGLRLHAWINPYRVGGSADNAVCSQTFTVDDKVYYDPSAPAVQKKVLDGIRELVQGYAIDGVQFDDYFYPTGALPADGPADFEQAYVAYAAAGGTASIGDWRRQQVSALIAAAYSLCHERAGCVFGVSPSHQAEATTVKMYADVRLWMARPGYLDYICPQIYVGFQNQTAPFTQVLEVWSAYPRCDGVQLYAGLALYKAGLQNDGYAGSGAAEWAGGGDILAREVAAVRTKAAFAGMAFYSWRYFSPPVVTDGYAADIAQQEAQNLLAVIRP